MPTDQVESLTHERSDASRVIESLPVKEAEPLKDLIALDRSEEESALSKGIFTGLSWLFYAVALGSLGLMAWALFRA